MAAPYNQPYDNYIYHKCQKMPFMYNIFIINHFNKC